MARSSVSSVAKDHRRWLATVGDELRGSAIQNLESVLEEESLPALRTAGVELSHLATYCGTKGSVAVLDGDENGYADIGKAVTYRYLALLIDAKSFSTTAFLHGVGGGHSLTGKCGICSCLFCYGIACDDSAVADDCGGVLHAMTTIPKALDEKFWRSRVFEPFALRMYFDYRGMDEEGGLLPDVGVYSEAAASLSRQVPLSASETKKLCDYHCANMVDRGGSHVPEFTDSPFDLIPFEIMALRKLHARKNIEVAAVDHPLLTGPLAQVERIRRPPDALAMRVEHVYRSIFGADA